MKEILQNLYHVPVITLIFNRGAPKGDNCCGCSNRNTLCVTLAIEVILVVIGTLALCQVGVFKGFLQAKSIAILSSAGFLFVMEIACVFPPKKAPYQATERPKLNPEEQTQKMIEMGHTLEKRDIGWFVTLNLTHEGKVVKKVFPVVLHHVADQRGPSLDDDTFLLYFEKDDDFTLGNISVTFRYSGCHTTYKHNNTLLTDPKSSILTDIASEKLKYHPVSS